jgi:hypothetical protein
MKKIEFVYSCLLVVKLSFKMKMFFSKHFCFQLTSILDNFNP